MKRMFEAPKTLRELRGRGVWQAEIDNILDAVDLDMEETVNAAILAERKRFVSLCEQAMDAVPCPENDAESAQSLTAYALADSAFRGDTTLRHRPALAPYFVAKAK